MRLLVALVIACVAGLLLSSAALASPLTQDATPPQIKSWQSPGVRQPGSPIELRAKVIDDQSETFIGRITLRYYSNHKPGSTRGRAVSIVPSSVGARCGHTVKFVVRPKGSEGFDAGFYRAFFKVWDEAGNVSRTAHCDVALLYY